VKLYDRGVDFYLFNIYKPHLNFTNAEISRGKLLLSKLGVPPNATWVCIHNRDVAYLDKITGTRVAHHDYRNFSINSMIPAAEILSDRGYYIIRMGSIVSEIINNENSKIIDYANSPLRDDFFDIYLLANCTYFIGCDSGLSALPTIFRRRIGMINYTIYNNFFDKNYQPCHVIFKHFWHKTLQRYLSISEIFDRGLHNAGQSQIYEAAGVEMVSNSEEEILDFSKEIDDREKGVWQLSLEDVKLHQRLYEIVKSKAPKDFKYEIGMCIGTKFLRDNPYLLD